ncbi:MAG: hypothetical protein IPO45_14720 [Saprospiraceae bacterium]|nr:hypothetical protein [Candidatus Brachybacter algidus]
MLQLKFQSNPIQRFLHALSIHHVGKSFKLLAEEIENVLDLASWTKEHFEGIKDIGPVVAQNVIAYFGDESNVNMIKEMEDLGVNLKATAKDRRAVLTNTDHHLSGKQFYLPALCIKWDVRKHRKKQNHWELRILVLRVQFEYPRSWG